MGDPNEARMTKGLIKRAAEAGRTPEEQRQLEDHAFQMGYKYCTQETGDHNNGDSVVRERFLAGQELGRRILGNQGRMFA